MHLFHDQHEDVSLERCAANSRVTPDAENGLELLLPGGGFAEGGETFVKNSWLRLPKGAKTMILTGTAVTQVWIKRDHMAMPPKAPLA
jgi:hypothetical protein